VPSFGRSPPSRGPSIECAPQAVGPQDTIEAHGSRGPSDGAAGGDKVPVFDAANAAAAAAQVTIGDGSMAPEVLPEGDTNVTAKEVATANPAALTGPAEGAFPSTAAADDDVVMEEPGVILGHPTLRAPGDVSLDDTLGMARWVLTQAQNVLRRESGGIVDERQCLLLWASMLQERTMAERARVEARQQHLDVREELLNRLPTAINNRDCDSQKTLAEAKELYASVEARANGTIKQADELIVRVHATEEQEQAVDELEQKLQEREAPDDLRLEHELASLATHESSLESREAALAAEQKDFEDVRASVLARELAANVRENALDTKATEVADRERRLAKQ
jgi:hypothetical protein